jgi:predicted small secreted protein
MHKRSFLWLILAAVILLHGCETSKGVAKGIGSTAEGMAEGIGSTAEGVGRDSFNLWQALVAADDWFKKNFW